jgi:hypothetical protein
MEELYPVSVAAVRVACGGLLGFGVKLEAGKLTIDVKSDADIELNVTGSTPTTLVFPPIVTETVPVPPIVQPFVGGHETLTEPETVTLVLGQPVVVTRRGQAARSIAACRTLDI